MFRWLHLSDIHVGITDQDWLWPTLKHAFFDDLSRLVQKTGSPDLLLFSGDMAQMGRASEFDRFSGILHEINCHLDTLGPVPPFVAAPGNHDMSRPKAGGPLEAALRQVPSDAGVLRQVWDAGSDYQRMLSEVFANFTAWQDGLIAEGLHLAPTGRGPLPGDMALEVPFDGGNAGIVVLNSTWLQLSGDDYRKRLHIDPRQLNGVTGGDPVAWCRERQIRLLVTHQPPDWLHPISRSLWEGEISPPGRFDLHMFGHMHRHASSTMARGGGLVRRELQAASVFGLEFVTGAVERSHGYSMVEIGERYGGRGITVWPRTLRTMGDGSRKLVPDHDHGLTEDNDFTWPLTDVPVADGARPRPAHVALELDGSTDAEDRARLDTLRYHLAAAPAHRAVRRVERQEAEAALARDGVLWIGTDWGLGGDGFLWCLLSGEGAEQPIFRLDLEDYDRRDSYLDRLRSELGCSFEQLCEFISLLPGSTLLLDNVPSTQRVLGERAIESDLEEVAGIVQEYAPSTRVVLRGRPKFAETTKILIELKPFEEADVADYVRAHRLGGAAYARPDAISTMWRHTGGSPVRLDTMLESLQVTTLADLVRSEDGAVVESTQAGVPATLVGAISELRNSGVPALSRAYDLLEALTSLPRGEQLDRIKRFFGAHPFFHNHALELASRGLIETVHLVGLAAANAAPAAKTLMVPRTVLEYVRRAMTPDRRREIDDLAIELYFGSKWKSGEIATSPAGKRCADPLCEPYEVINASTLVQRIIARSRDGANNVAFEAAVRLASAFVEILLKGDHFRSAALLCEEVIGMVPPEGNEKRIDVLRHAQGRSVRMLQRPADAREILRAIDRDNLNKSQRRRTDLELALASESLHDEDAVRFAREVLKGGRIDPMGLQAQSILAEQEPDVATRLRRLAEIEASARRKGAFITANNIALTRAGLEKDIARQEDHLRRVTQSAATDGDFYNGTRAIVRTMRLRSIDGSFDQDQLSKLIKAYQHLHNERGTVLFDDSHEALWAAFRSEGGHANMFRLFRHSSLIWRLRGQEEREDSYIDVLAPFASTSSCSAPELAREMAYYRARSSAAVERRQTMNVLSSRAAK